MIYTVQRRPSLCHGADAAIRTGRESEGGLPMEVSSIFVDGEQEALRFKWIESEKAGFDLGETAIRNWVQCHWWGYLRAALAGAPSGQALLGRAGPRRLRPPATQVRRKHPSPRPHPRPPQSRAGKPRRHLLGAPLGHCDGAGPENPRSPRHQQPPSRRPLRPSRPNLIRLIAPLRRSPESPAP